MEGEEFKNPPGKDQRCSVENPVNGIYIAAITFGFRHTVCFFVFPYELAYAYYEGFSIELGHNR